MPCLAARQPLCWCLCAALCSRPASLQSARGAASIPPVVVVVPAPGVVVVTTPAVTAVIGGIRVVGVGVRAGIWAVVACVLGTAFLVVVVLVLLLFAFVVSVIHGLRLLLGFLVARFLVVGLTARLIIRAPCLTFSQVQSARNRLVGSAADPGDEALFLKNGR